MLHPPVAGSCFGAAAVPCVLPPAERGLGTPPPGLCVVCRHSEQTWGIWALASRALPSSGLAVGTAWGFHGPDGAAFVLWMVPRPAHSSDSHPAASPGSGPPARPKPAAHPGDSSLRAQGLREHTCVQERGSVHAMGLPANNKQQDRDLLHLFLCTSLPPSAAPGVGSAFNTPRKIIVTGRTTLQQDKTWQLPTAQPSVTEGYHSGDTPLGTWGRTGM